MEKITHDLGFTLSSRSNHPKSSHSARPKTLDQFKRLAVRTLFLIVRTVSIYLFWRKPLVFRESLLTRPMGEKIRSVTARGESKKYL